MNIEVGDLFVVTRGNPMFRHIEQHGDTVTLSDTQYDRSHEGRVFRAMEVCGQMVAAEIVFGSTSLGRVRSLNLTELEVWPVTKGYLDALIVAPHKEIDG